MRRGILQTVGGGRLELHEAAIGIVESVLPADDREVEAQCHGSHLTHEKGLEVVSVRLLSWVAVVVSEFLLLELELFELLLELLLSDLLLSDLLLLSELLLLLLLLFILSD